MNRTLKTYVFIPITIIVYLLAWSLFDALGGALILLGMFTGAYAAMSLLEMEHGAVR